MNWTVTLTGRSFWMTCSPSCRKEVRQHISLRFDSLTSFVLCPEEYYSKYQSFENGHTALFSSCSYRQNTNVTIPPCVLRLLLKHAWGFQDTLTSLLCTCSGLYIYIYI